LIVGAPPKLRFGGSRIRFHVDKQTKLGLADLVEQIADGVVFDEEKYFQFNRTIGSGDVDIPIGAAANELTEYYSDWLSSRKAFTADRSLNEKRTRKARQRLKELADEIRLLR
jgi:hypothetical protein